VKFVFKTMKASETWVCVVRLKPTLVLIWRWFSGNLSQNTTLGRSEAPEPFPRETEDISFCIRTARRRPALAAHEARHSVLAGRSRTVGASAVTHLR